MPNENYIIPYPITTAKEKDTEEILALYHANLGGLAGWDEHYPSLSTIAFDLERDSLFVMKNEKNEIIAAISIDQDPAVEELSCWNMEIMPAGELSRICVREDMKGQGIARALMEHAFRVLRERGYKMVHILVRKCHTVAMRAYAPLHFQTVGSCQLFNKDYVCMERRL